MPVRRSQKSQFDYHSYRGRTTVTDWLKRIALVLAVLVVILVAVLFFGQGSISYTDEGLRIHWPFSHQSEPQTPDPGNVTVIEGDPAALPDSSQEGETTPPERPQEDASSILSVSLSSLLDGSAAQLAQAAQALEPYGTKLSLHASADVLTGTDGSAGLTPAALNASVDRVWASGTRSDVLAALEGAGVDNAADRLVSLVDQLDPAAADAQAVWSE